MGKNDEKLTNSRKFTLAILAIVAASALVAVPTIVVPASAYHQYGGFFDSTRDCRNYFLDLGYSQRDASAFCRR